MYSQFYYHGYDEGHEGVYPSVEIVSTTSGRNVSLQGTGSFVLAFTGVWLEKEVGDLIDISTMIGHTDYFGAQGDLAVSGVDFSNPIETRIGKTIYLALMDTTLVEQYEREDPNYGWIAIKVGSGGELTITESAYSLDGTPLYVGGGAAIPEPTSLVLLAFGCALVGLKRN